MCDMSSGFTCNIGQKMPDNWAYDQFTEIYDANSEFLEMGYDKCIVIIMVWQSRQSGVA